MSIIKGFFPYLAHYLSSNSVMSFQQDSVKIDDFSSQEALPLDSSTLKTLPIPPGIQGSPKKSIRWLLQQGYTPTLKDKKVSFSVSVHAASGVLLRTLEGHTGYVYTLAMLTSGTLASGSGDGTIKFWIPSTGECVHTFSGHTSTIYALKEVPGGILASGSSDCSIKLWNTSTRQCIRTLTGHIGYVYSLEALPEEILASGAGDNSIKIWNISTGLCIRTLTGHTGPVYALKKLPGGLLASGSGDYNIKIWNPSTGMCVRTLVGHSSDIYSFEVFPGDILISGSYDGIIKVWNISTGQCIRTIEGHSSAVCSLVHLPGGILASTSYDNTLKLWNPLTGQSLSTMKGHSGYIYALTLLPGGILASGSEDRTIKQWKISFPNTEAVNTDQINSYCDQAIQHLKTKAFEEDDGSIDNALLCPVTGELFVDPVIIDDEGHTFERSAILEHFTHQNNCPTCRAPIKPEVMQSPIPNRLIRDLASKIREKSPVPLLAANSKDEKTIHRYLGLARDSAKEGNHEEALKHLTEVISSSNKSEHYADLPPLYEKLHKPSKPALFKAALAYVFLFKYQFREGKIDQAKNTIKEALRLAGSSRAALPMKITLAALYHAQGEGSEACVLYMQLAEECLDKVLFYREKAFLCNPKNPEIYDKLAVFYEDSRRVHLYLLGFINLYDIDHEKAVAFYDHARSLAPQNPLVHVTFLSRLNREQVPEKLEIYRLLADLFTKKANSISIQEDLSVLGANQVYLKKALRSEENYDFHRYVSALLQHHEKEQAEKVYLKWSTLARCNPVEVIYEGIDAIGETSALLERLVSLYSQNRDPAVLKAAGKLGDLYKAQTRIPEALKAYELAYNQFKDFEIGLKLAELLRQQKRDIDSFKLCYTLTQEAFFSNEDEKVQKGMKQLLELKPAFAKLSADQKQFIMMAGIVERLRAENQELRAQMGALKAEKAEMNLLALPVVEKPSSNVTKMTLQKEIRGHVGNVNSTVVLPGDILASGSDDGTIMLWNPSTGKCIHALEGHASKVWSLAVFRSGILASGSDDGIIKLWDPSTGKCIRTWEGHSNGVFSLVKLPGGNLASGSGDGTIKFWNSLTGECFRTIQGHSDQVNSLVEVPGGLLASGSKDTTAKLWNTLTGECMLIIKGHILGVTSLAVLSGGILASGSEDGTIQLWNYLTAEHRGSLEGYSGSISSLAVLPRSSRAVLLGSFRDAFPQEILAVGLKNGRLQLWDTSNHEYLYSQEEDLSSISSLSVLPGNILVSGSLSEIKLWDISIKRSGIYFNTVPEDIVDI